MNENEVIFERYITELKTIFGDSTEEMREILEKIKKYKELIAQKEKVAEYDEKIAKLHEEKKELSEKNQEEFLKLKEIKAKIENTEAEIEDDLLRSAYEVDKKDVSDEILTIDSKMKEKDSEIQSTEEEKKDFIQKNEAETKRVYDELNSQISKISEDIKKKINEQKTDYIAGDEIDKINIKIKQNEKELAILDEEDKKLNTSLSEYQDKLNKICDEIKGPVRNSLQLYLDIDSIKIKMGDIQKKLKENEEKRKKILEVSQKLEEAKKVLEGKKSLKNKDIRNAYVSFLYMEKDITPENLDYVEMLFEEYLKYDNEYTTTKTSEEKNSTIVDEEINIDPEIESTSENNEEKDETTTKEGNDSISSDDLNEKYGIVGKFQGELRNDYIDVLENIYKLDIDSADRIVKHLSNGFNGFYDYCQKYNISSENVYNVINFEEIWDIVKVNIDSIVEKNNNDSDFWKLYSRFYDFVKDSFAQCGIDMVRKSKKSEKVEPEVVIDVNPEDNTKIENGDVKEEKPAPVEENIVGMDEGIAYEDNQLKGNNLPPLYVKFLYHIADEKTYDDVMEVLYLERKSEEIKKLKAPKKSKIKGIFKRVKDTLKIKTKTEESQEDKVDRADLGKLVSGDMPSSEFVLNRQAMGRRTVDKLQENYKKLYNGEDFNEILEELGKRRKSLDAYLDDFYITFSEGEYYRNESGKLCKVSNPQGEKHKVKMEDVRAELDIVMSNVEAIRDEHSEKKNEDYEELGL